jgi:DNA-directed RNA polymerase subunit RPC12/RpoP
MVRVKLGLRVIPNSAGITVNHPTATSDAAGIAPAETTIEQHPCLVTSETIYICSRCAITWAYQAVRNTGRCPACGDGLRRFEDPSH